MLIENKYVQRQEYFEFLKGWKDKHIIKVITGVRRSGKSTLLFLFRKFLLKNGFLMLQESVYCKLALNGTAVNAIVDNVHKNKPEEGLIQLLTVTEKQYSKMDIVLILIPC